MGKTLNHQVTEMPMSHYKRIQNPFLKSAALIAVNRGDIVIIEDEAKKRENKEYTSLIPLTMTDILNASVICDKRW